MTDDIDEISIKSDFIDLLKEKYLSYALSTITDRALPRRKRWAQTRAQKTVICNV